MLYNSYQRIQLICKRITSIYKFSKLVQKSTFLHFACKGIPHSCAHKTSPLCVFKVIQRLCNNAKVNISTHCKYIYLDFRPKSQTTNWKQAELHQWSGSLVTFIICFLTEGGMSAQLSY